MNILRYLETRKREAACRELERRRAIGFEVNAQYRRNRNKSLTPEQRENINEWLPDILAGREPKSAATIK